MNEPFKVAPPSIRSPAELAGQLATRLAGVDARIMHGRITQAVGTLLRAYCGPVEVGEICRLRANGLELDTPVEVVGFADGQALLCPLGDLLNISTTTLVVPTGSIHEISVGPWLLGRVLDGLGRPLDGLPLPRPDQVERVPVEKRPPHPMSRMMIGQPFATGIRAVDSMLTCAQGQRIGIFAPAGVGKSTLLGMLAKTGAAEVVVVGLIGERGREVREFIEHELGQEGLRKAVVVCATSDRPAMERMKAAAVATTVAEYFRDRGARVLLLIDSITRYVRALREVGLAAGEPPARRGYPPSVFAAMPRLLERAGMSDKGSITAFYSVLVEGDDMTEPVADESRSILDGHIVLSRKLAAENHYPAIDVLASVSRTMGLVAKKDHIADAAEVRNLLAKYEEIELLVRIGEYQKGSDAQGDRAVDRIEDIRNFLQQPRDEFAALPKTLERLKRLAIY